MQFQLGLEPSQRHILMIDPPSREDNYNTQAAGGENINDAMINL
jgi:hypothetical protein